MKILQIENTDRYRTQQFIDLPFRIYRDNPVWVPPMSSDVKIMFDKQHNPYYQHSQAAFFLAVSADGVAVGRLAVLNNRHFNEYNQEQTAFFSLFECQNDLLASQGLFNAGFEWARRAGLTRITGPRGFSSLDGLGMLVKGFEHRPAFGIPYNLPYYPSLVESSGFSPLTDIVRIPAYGYRDPRKNPPCVEARPRTAGLIHRQIPFSPRPTPPDSRAERPVQRHDPGHHR